ncbi:MAG TPA: hypothetical protein VFM60_02185 [Salinimicrobium sp.]|nr:hypothetical protein [Salinimicrobium sp.]
MKKLILLTFCALGFAFQSHGQEIADNALGLRMGDSNGFGIEISYQNALGGNNRMEFDLGWSDSDNFDAFKLVGLYQWVMNIDGGFNWYVGAGAGVGSVSHNDNDSDDDGFFALVAGDVGIEYNFDFPLLISLDFRPEIGINYPDDVGFDIALGLRYQF